MPLTKLQFRPGINRESTSYANEGGWFDCDKVRFHLGYPEKIGGWQKYSTNVFLGTARRLHNWVANDGSDYLGVGTNLKYYIEEGGAFSDITPIRLTTSAGDVTFAATNGSSTLTVSDTNHGAVANSFVTYSGATSLGGDIAAGVLNQEFQITRVIDANTYEISTAPFVANASDTGNGGSSTVGAYQVNAGLNAQVGGVGFGAGSYGGVTGSAATTQLSGGITASDTTITLLSVTGFNAGGGTVLINNELITYTGISVNDLTGCVRGTSGTTAASHSNGSTVQLALGNVNPDDDFVGWGASAATAAISLAELRTWSHDNFGEDLIINPRDGAIYYWDKTNGLDDRAVEIGTLGGATETPVVAKQVIVSDTDRHVIAFGCNPQGTSTIADQDPLLIRFSDQESLTDWAATATNTAGDLRIGSGSKFVQAVETKRETVVFTDKSMHSLRFIGPPFTFGLTQVSANISIIGPKAAASVDDLVFWMGNDNFYVYDGRTNQLPCTVRDYVFQDFNYDQAEKVICGVNSQWSEVVWFYPSETNSTANGGDGENDRYVVYNYGERVWYYGSLRRDAWIDRGVRQYPIGAAPDSSGDNYLYNHELGNDADGAALTAFIESSQIDIGDGDRFSFIDRMIPDVTFIGSTSVTPSATFTVSTRNYPGGAYLQNDAQAVAQTATAPVEQFTQQLNMRLRGRSFSFKIDSSALGTNWRLGAPRIGIRQDGRQ